MSINRVRQFLDDAADLQARLIEAATGEDREGLEPLIRQLNTLWQGFFSDESTVATLTATDLQSIQNLNQQLVETITSLRSDVALQIFKLRRARTVNNHYMTSL